MKSLNTLIGLGCAMLTLATAFPQPAFPEESHQSSYELVIIGNQAFGEMIVKGDYQRAIPRIRSRSRYYPFAAATNLCAAHTVLGQLDKAKPYCDRAIDLNERASLPRPKHLKGRLQVASEGALAYSNRGVLRALLGNGTGAEEDFRAAIEFKADLRAPAHNFARLNMETTEPVAVRISQ